MTITTGSDQNVSASCYLARGAVIIGDVVTGDDVGIWFNAVVRGDNDRITIGARSNIQDGAVLHTDAGHPIVIGTDVTIGHLAMLHGCSIGDGSTIGINAVVLNRAVIGKNCLIGGNALVTEGTDIPDGSLVIGSPGKIVRALRPEEIESMRLNAASYVSRIATYASGRLAVRVGE